MRRRRLPVTATAVAVVAAVLASCSAESTTSTAPGSTSMAPDTTTTTSRPVTTGPGEPTEAEILGMASRSGCTPDDATGLPDGEWYGYATGATPSTIDFDLACWFSGDAANIAAAFDGIEGGAPNDYVVWNRNEAVRLLPVGPDVEVHWYRTGDPDDDTTGTVGEWIADKESLADELGFSDVFWLGMWITVEDGVVTDIEEMWVP